MILNDKCQTIKTTLDDVTTKKYSEIISKMVNQTRGHIAEIEEGVSVLAWGDDCSLKMGFSFSWNVDACLICLFRTNLRFCV